MNSRSSLVVWALFSLSLWVAGPAAAAEPQPATLFPRSTAIYLEVPRPKQLLGLVLDHPLRKQLEELEAYRAALSDPEFLKFKVVVAVIEAQLGMQWRPALEMLTEGGMHVGFDPATEGVGVVVRCRDQQSLEKMRDTLMKLAREDAQRKGEPDPIKSGQYNGVDVYRAGEARFATVARWLLLTNKEELGKALLDNYSNHNASSLGDNQQFAAARESFEGSPAAWAFVDVRQLREAGAAKELFREKSNNPAVEMLLGGVLATLGKTPYATAALYADTDRLRLELAAPHDAAWIGRREYFFSSKGLSAPLVPKQQLLSLGAYRDVARMWIAKDELFEENVAAELEQADSNLSTVFSGLDFGEEVLGAADGDIQFVAARQEFEKLDVPLPDIKLPAAAVIFRLNEPEKIRQRLKVAFQSFMGIVNIGAGQNGQPQFDINTERQGDSLLVSATYLPEENADGLINYNFSPTVGFVQERFIISSTKELGRELVGIAKQAGAAMKPGINTRAQVDLQVLRSVLDDNRAQLVANNMLEEGNTKEQAEQEVGLLLRLLEVGKHASLQLVGSDKSLRIGFDLQLDVEK